MPVLALVDLYGSTPLSSTAAAGGTASSLSSQYSSARLRMAGLFHVHRGLYDERPGMKLLQVCVGLLTASPPQLSRYSTSRGGMDVFVAGSRM